MQKTLRDPMTANRPTATPTATPTPARRRRGTRMVSDTTREALAVRCSSCGGQSVPPCYLCWMRRNVARGGRFDPNDQHPHSIRPSGIPNTWSDALVRAVWLDVEAGVDARAISRRYELQVSAAVHVRKQILRYIQEHA